MAWILAAASLAQGQASDRVVFVRGPGQPAQSYAASGDQALVARLTSLGYTVEVYDENDVAMVAASQGAALLFFSETINSGTPVTVFANAGVALWSLPVPILTNEPYLYDDLRMTGNAYTRTTPDPGNGGIDNGDYGNAPPFDRIRVVDVGHPLAADLVLGPLQLSGGAFVELGYGVPGPGATVIATLDPATPWNQNQAPNPALGSRATYFVYDAGDPLFDGTPAPARRIGFPGRHGAALQFIEAGGWTLLDQAAGYAAGAKLIHGGASWTDAAAWVPPGLPLAGDAVVVLGPGVVTGPGGVVTVDALTLRDGGELALPAGELTVTEAVAVEDGLLGVSGALVHVGGELQVASGSTLELTGGGRLRLSGATAQVDGLLRVRDGELGRDGGARIDVRVAGELDVDQLDFSGGDAQGLHVQAGATLTRLRRVAFSDPAGGGRHLTIEAASLDLSAPGCTFSAPVGGGDSVRLVDTAPGGGLDVVLNLEQRASSGAGAGPAFEDEQGSAINWVHAAPDTTRGEAVGFPQVAWDLNTFATYATYVAFRDAEADGDDRIHVFEPDGGGLEASYHLRVAAGLGDVVGYPWWDQVGGQRVVYTVTDAGYVLRHTDPGGGFAVRETTTPVDPALAVQVMLDGGPVTFTSPPLTDGVQLYAAATTSTRAVILCLSRDDGSVQGVVDVPTPVTSELATELQDDGLILLYAGTGGLGTGDVVLVDTGFGGGPSGFVYRDDTFRGTNNPGDASGAWDWNDGYSGAGLMVEVGANGQEMSGGWARSFTVTGAPTAVTVELRVRLVFDAGYESNEEGQALLSVDGALVGVAPNDWLARFVGNGNGGPDMDTGWLALSFDLPLGAGTHELIVGAYNDQSTVNSEITEVFIDDVRVTARYPAGGGQVYAVDTQTALVVANDPSPTAAVTGAPYAAYDHGVFVGDASGAVHGFDQADAGLVPLGADWPLTPGSDPVQGGVFFDWDARRLFWGDAAGRVYGYDLGPDKTSTPFPLAGFPLTPLGAAGVEGGTYDAGVLWLSDLDGGLQAVDVAPAAAPTGPDFRFGSGQRVSSVSQEFSVGRPMVATASGRFLVIDVVADPTPGSP